jgi:hypothetical protein
MPSGLPPDKISGCISLPNILIRRCAILKVLICFEYFIFGNLCPRPESRRASQQKDTILKSATQSCKDNHHVHYNLSFIIPTFQMHSGSSTKIISSSQVSLAQEIQRIHNGLNPTVEPMVVMCTRQVHEATHVSNGVTDDEIRSKHIDSPIMIGDLDGSRQQPTKNSIQNSPPSGPASIILRDYKISSTWSEDHLAARQAFRSLVAERRSSARIWLQQRTVDYSGDDEASCTTTARDDEDTATELDTPAEQDALASAGSSTHTLVSLEKTPSTDSRRRSSRRANKSMSRRKAGRAGAARACDEDPFAHRGARACACGLGEAVSRLFRRLLRQASP